MEWSGSLSPISPGPPPLYCSGLPMLEMFFLPPFSSLCQSYSCPSFISPIRTMPN